MEQSINEVDKNQQNVKEFKPKPKMIRLIQAMADPTQNPTITNWCDQAKINRTTYYKWFNDVAFVQWFNAEWEMLMKKTKPYLDNIGLRKAATNYRYWLSMQQKVSGFVPKTETVSGLNLAELSDEELAVLRKITEKSSKSETDPSGTDQA